MANAAWLGSGATQAECQNRKDNGENVVSHDTSIGIDLLFSRERGCCRYLSTPSVVKTEPVMVTVLCVTVSSPTTLYFG